MKRKPYRRQRGFTLVEVLTVILIIAVLIVAVFSVSAMAMHDARMRTVESDLHDYDVALTTYMYEDRTLINSSKVDRDHKKIAASINEYLPKTMVIDEEEPVPLSGTICNSNADLLAFKTIKDDPWGNPYYVVIDTEARNYGASEYFISVMSAGANSSADMGSTLDKDDVFMLAQYHNGAVTSKTYAMEEDTSDSTGTALVVGQSGLSTSGSTITGPRNQGDTVENNGNAGGNGSGGSGTTNPPSGEHEHRYVVTGTSAASCTSGGSRTLTCSCGATQSQNIAALGHLYGDFEVTKEPTCSEDGVQTATCKRSGCSATKTEAINAIGHNMEDTYTVLTAPTCGKAGEKVKNCQNEGCDYSISDEIPATGSHTYGAWKNTKTETCITTGQRTRTCTGCGHAEIETIAATGVHTYGDWVTTKVVTCLIDGEQTRKCTTSGCTATQKQAIEAVGSHSYGNWTTTKEATCLVDGSKTRSCTRTDCKETQTETIKAAGSHSYGSWKTTREATCVSAGEKVKTCTKCSDAVTEAIKATGVHKYGNWVTTKAATCLVIGEQTRKCTASGCTALEKEVIAATGHTDTNKDNLCDSCKVTLAVVEGLGNLKIESSVEGEKPGDVIIIYNKTGSGGTITGTTPPSDKAETPPDVEVEDLVDLISFEFGTFKASTNYTPGTYETVEYETTVTSPKYPVAYTRINYCYWLVDENNNILSPLEATVETLKEKYSNYVVYNANTGETRTLEGKTADSLIICTIMNSSADTLENAIYMAAYLNMANNTTDWHIATWGGSNYVEANHDAAIRAIKDFTTTKTVTNTKQVQITKPSSSTNYVYIPGSTMQAVDGMTWREWLASEYNTTGQTDVEIRDENYNAVSLDSVIDDTHDYGFAITEYLLSGTWKFNDVLTQPATDISQKIICTVPGISSTPYDGIHAGTSKTPVFPGSGAIPETIISMGYDRENSGTGYPAYNTMNSGGWYSTAYQTVDFGSEPQAVSKEFYEWFIVNATEQKAELIAFSINETYGTTQTHTFNAEKGMTWAEFVNSPYNTNGIFKLSENNEYVYYNCSLDPSELYYPSRDVYGVNGAENWYNDDWVTAENEIIEGKTYWQSWDD